MLPILFNRNYISHEKLEVHKALIYQIINNEIRYPKVKQLANIDYQGEAIYRAKIDKKNRLIFTYVQEQDARKLLILAVNNHNYPKLKRQFSASSNSQHQHWQFAPETPEIPVLLPSPQTTDLEFKPSIAYKGQTLILDEQQQQVYSYSGALILVGPPGAGKSSLLFSLLQQQVQNPEPAAEESGSSILPSLFISPSQNLIALHQGLYQQEQPEQQNRVVFSTWEDLLQQQHPEQQLIGKNDFSSWLQQQKISEDANALHYELSLIKALGYEHYSSLGHRQCHFSSKEPLRERENGKKQLMLKELLRHWEAHLQQNALLDPMVTTLPQVAQPTYRKIYADETQNLPPVALASLIPRAQYQQCIAALDIDQCLFFSPFMHNCIQELFHRHYKSYSEHQLTLDWRSLPQITAVGNNLLDAKHQLDDGDKRRPYKHIQSPHQNSGVVSWVDNAHLQTLHPYGSRAGTVVLVTQMPSLEERLRIQACYQCSNILTPAQAIGLDFETVILHNPFSESQGLKSLAKHAPGTTLSLEQINAINALYIAIKRAQQRLFIIEDEYSRWQHLANHLLGDLPHNQFTLQPLQPINKNEEQQAREVQLQYHLVNQNYTAAENIRQAMNNNSQEAITKHSAPTDNTPPPKPVAIAAKKTSKTSKSNGKPPVSSEQNKVLTQLITAMDKGDVGALKRFLESPDAAIHLKNPLPQIISGAQQSTLLQWLWTNHRELVNITLKNMLLNLKKNSGKKNIANPTYISLFTETSEGYSLLAIILPTLLEKAPKLIPFILNKKLIKPNVAQSMQQAYLQIPTLANTIKQLIDAKPSKDLKKAIDCLAENNALPPFEILAMAKISPKQPTPNQIADALTAASRGDIDTLERLQRNGIALDRLHQAGCTLAYVAAQVGRRNVLEFLHRNKVALDTPSKSGVTPAHAAAQDGQRDVLEFLDSKNVALDTPNENGETPAHAAAQNGQRDVLAFLHSKKVALDTPDKDGLTPAHFAAFNGQRNALAFLHSKKVALDIPDKNGATPAYFAAHNGQRDVLEFLHSKKVALDTPDKNGATPAHAAAKDGQRDVLEFLDSKKVALDTPDKDGVTPAHFAAFNGQRDALAFLHSKKVALDIPDKNGATPAYFAAHNGQRDVLEFLHSKKVALDASEKDGATPLFRAAERGQQKCVEFLLMNKACKKTSITITIKQLHELCNGLAEEIQDKIRGNAQRFLQEKQLNGQSEEEQLCIYPHEIATIMGHQALAKMILNHPDYNSSPVITSGFFSQKTLTPTTLTEQIKAALQK